MKTSKLNKSPLVDVIIEVRFQSSIAPDAMIGFVFSKIADKFNKGVQALPIAQLPTPVRTSDPNLRYQPTHKFLAENFYLNIGPQVIGLGYSTQQNPEIAYMGWAQLHKECKRILNQITPFITNIERVGVRYTNLFHERSFFEQLEIGFDPGLSKFGNITDETIAFLVRNEDMVTKVTLANDATLTTEQGTSQGQVMDIDTSITHDMPVEDVHIKIENSQRQSEEIFFSLLSEEFLKKLEPTK